MTNRWAIPKDIECQIRRRDLNCIYCRTEFSGKLGSPRSHPSWEHIINDASIITFENIALCCRGCNASKGQKTLAEWLESGYCSTHKITYATMAPVARRAYDSELREKGSDK